MGADLAGAGGDGVRPAVPVAGRRAVGDRPAGSAAATAVPARGRRRGQAGLPAELRLRGHADGRVTVSHATGGSKYADPQPSRRSSAPRACSASTRRPTSATSSRPTSRRPIRPTAPCRSTAANRWHSRSPRTCPTCCRSTGCAAAGDPPEKAQLMQLALSVDRVASTDGALRLTSPGPDWLTVHGGAVVAAGRPPFRNGLFVQPRRPTGAVAATSGSSGTRRCWARPGCAYDTRALEPGPAARTGRARRHRRRMGGAGVDAGDRSRAGRPLRRADDFVPPTSARSRYLSERGPSPVWTLTAGTLVAARPGGRPYAAFGDPTWNHFQVGATHRPGRRHGRRRSRAERHEPVQQGDARARRRRRPGAAAARRAVDQELARAPLCPRSRGRFSCTSRAFDDTRAGQRRRRSGRGRPRPGARRSRRARRRRVSGVQRAAGRQPRHVPRRLRHQPLPVVRRPRRAAATRRPTCTPPTRWARRRSRRRPRSLAARSADIAAAMSPSATPSNVSSSSPRCSPTSGWRSSNAATG